MLLFLTFFYDKKVGSENHFFAQILDETLLDLLSAFSGNESMDKNDGRLFRWTQGHKNRWTYRHIDSQIDKWTDRHIDRQIGT